MRKLSHHDELRVTVDVAAGSSVRMSLNNVLGRPRRRWKTLVGESETSICGNRVRLDARSSGRIEGGERAPGGQEEGEEVDRVDK